MILVICDSVADRLAFHRYLRHERIISIAPPPSEFESSLLARDYSTALFFCPFKMVLSGISTGNIPRIAIGKGAERMSRYMRYCEEPYSEKLLDFLRDMEAFQKCDHVGEIQIRGKTVYNAGYIMKLTPAEYLALSYLMNFDSATPERLSYVCVGALRVDDDERYIGDVAPIISRLNKKAMETGGRRIVSCRNGVYELCNQIKKPKEDKKLSEILFM